MQCCSLLAEAVESLSLMSGNKEKRMNLKLVHILKKQVHSSISIAENELFIKNFIFFC